MWVGAKLRILGIDFVWYTKLIGLNMGVGPPGDASLW